MKPNTKIILHELKRHTPFTIYATIAATVLVAIPFFLNQQQTINLSESFFDILHPAHILVSSFATAAIFYKHQKKIFNALIIGVLGAIIIGSLSDVIFPYLQALALNFHPHFHLPIIEAPILIILVALIGSALGIILIQTKLPHFLHVFISVFASLFYLIAFSTTLNITYLAIAFIITFLAVIIPCCISDIIFPLLFLNKYKCKHCHEHK